MATLRRSTLLAIVAVSLIMGASCAPAAAPGPTAVPTKPSEASTAVPKPAASPAAKGETPAAKSNVSGDWKAEWDKVVAAANKEGKVVVVGSTGDLYRSAAMAFQKAYPEIQVEFSGMKGSDFAPKVLAERGAGLYLWDVHIGGATTALDSLKPKGVLDPVKPALLLPEVVDNSKWFGGFDRAWMDKDGQYIFGFEAGLQVTVFVNRDMVPESQLNSFDQLLDPQWKGKIVSGDLRTAGAHNGSTSWIFNVKGEDWIRKFFAQDIVIMKDERAEMESVVRGRYPIMIGINPASFQQFAKEGLAANIRALDPTNEASAALSTGSSHALLINNAPHPNAAKVYVNWLLTKEGQQAYTDATGLLSRRLDVAGGDQTFKPKPDGKYGELNAEYMMPAKQRVIDIAKEIIK